jgi:hypothetical protein
MTERTQELSGQWPLSPALAGVLAVPLPSPMRRPGSGMLRGPDRGGNYHGM